MKTLASFLRRKPRIQGFVFNWRGHESRARELERRIRDVIDVTVVNSDISIQGKYKGWVDLDENAYFAAQWNCAMALFKADVLFHIQADANHDDFESIIEQASSVFSRYKVGVYEPNLDYTDIRYDQTRLPSLEKDLAIVPFTDCTCWFVDGTIIRRLPPVDLSLNHYGWGIPRAIAALSQLTGKHCVRDYSFTIRHPRRRGYSSTEAMQQKVVYIESLGPEIHHMVLLLEQFRAELQPDR